MTRSLMRRLWCESALDGMQCIWMCSCMYIHMCGMENVYICTCTYVQSTAIVSPMHSLCLISVPRLTLPL